MLTYILIKNIVKPKGIIILISFILNEVIPSNAKYNIFFNEYLDSPTKLSCLSYSTIKYFYLINGTIPLKNKLTSSNCVNPSKTFLLMRR